MSGGIAHDKRQSQVSRLELEDASTPTRRTLVLSGELDVSSADQLEARVRQICDTTRTEVALDLSKLTFIDSSGLRAIVTAGEICELHGHEFVLIPGARNVRRVFELVRLADRLPSSYSSS
jgi:anti-anti-sigma factor